MGDNAEAAKTYIKMLEQMAADKTRREDAERATIKMSQKNWFERHQFYMLVIGAVLGAVASKILELI